MLLSAGEIYTDAKGRPIPRPERADYPDAMDYWRAVWAWKDRIAALSHAAFDDAFRKALRR